MPRVADNLGAVIIKVDVRPDGVAIVMLDDTSATLNTLTEAFGEELEGVIERIRDDRAIVGAVLVSGKRDSFVVGANLGALRGLKFAAEGERRARRAAEGFSRLRSLGKPVVAAVHGAALGGGFELALACRAIVVTDDPKTVVGLPEVQLGLLPGANGLLRVAERAGLRVALDLGLTGTATCSVKAKQLGLVDEVCPSTSLIEVSASCVRALLAGGVPAFAARPKRSARERLERMALERNAVGRAILFGKVRAAAKAKSRGHYPAVVKIVDVVERFAKKGFRAAADLEAKAFGELVMTEASRRLVEVFFATRALKKDLGKIEASALTIDPVYVSRLQTAYRREARTLVAEGVPVSRLDEALARWGWPVGSLELLDASEIEAVSRAFATPSRGVPMEEIQMRCSLQLVNEAMLCLGEGVLGSPRDGDVGAILGLGFPPFRGGPFRYVDAIGPGEILRRIRGYEARFGKRFCPAPALVERAKAGQSFYEEL